MILSNRCYGTEFFRLLGGHLETLPHGPTDIFAGKRLPFVSIDTELVRLLASVCMQVNKDKGQAQPPATAAPLEGPTALECPGAA